MAEGLRVYLCARWSRRKWMRQVARELEELGFEVVSTWHDLDGPNIGNDELMTDRALLACHLIPRCHLFIYFANKRGCAYPGGAEHSEYARAYDVGGGLSSPSILHVGEKAQLWHWLPGIEFFEDWDACKAQLALLAAKPEAQ